MADTPVRLLRLLALLPTRATWSGPELADRLGVTTRTVRNDVERLRDLGYEVEGRPGAGGGYRLAAGAALPPLLLDDDEAVAVALGLATAVSGSITGIEETSLRALTKLEQTMPSRLRHRIDALRGATVSASAGGPTVDPEVLTVLAQVCARRERLRFDYGAHDGASSVRDVEPHRVVHTGRRWYLLAWDTGAGDWRTFRADRIAPRVPTGPRFTPREVPGGDALAHVLRGVGSAAWPHRARVRIGAPADDVAQRISRVGGVLTPLDAATCLLETGGASLPELAGYLASLEVPFEVLEPDTLREVLRSMARRCKAAAAVTS
ncbi:YafY family transcriptional regulator [Actinotalea ferrariae]|uniref:helix-turn-helix transcriptional regulator n=1 Tax=Actinotalea ferrariae TaxID=1386098 RepID=UPI001C8C5634|nr:YafY family protein [Actinotalea ferrariae]MBX9244723.1 YafY family transcriptional regulator [Actinotalea ferrariae]